MKKAFEEYKIEFGKMYCSAYQYEHNDISVYIENNDWSTSEIMKIQYCPFCGAKIEIFSVTETLEKLNTPDNPSLGIKMGLE